MRLSDVAPYGRVTLVTGAGINGAQRDSMTTPKDLVPGQVYPLSLDLHLASWVFPKGHRIRIAVSNALWPMNWPTPYPMTTSLMLGGDATSRVTLPRVPVHGRRHRHLLRPNRSKRLQGSRGSAEAAPRGPASGRCCAMKPGSAAR